MGYCITQTDGSFEFSDPDGALKAIQGIPSGKYGWTHHDSSVDNLRDALEEWRWDYDKYGLNFGGEKIGDDQVLFDAIAPFVKEGSYLQMQGEDGCIWRWYFDGKTCEEQNATISFE